MSRSETAMEYFKNGYNCSQALVMTFQDLIPVEPNLLLKMSSSYLKASVKAEVFYCLKSEREGFFDIKYVVMQTIWARKITIHRLNFE